MNIFHLDILVEIIKYIKTAQLINVACVNKEFLLACEQNVKTRNVEQKIITIEYGLLRTETGEYHSNRDSKNVDDLFVIFDDDSMEDIYKMYFIDTSISLLKHFVFYNDERIIFMWYGDSVFKLEKLPFSMYEDCTHVLIEKNIKCKECQVLIYEENKVYGCMICYSARCEEVCCENCIEHCCDCDIYTCIDCEDMSICELCGGLLCADCEKDICKKCAEGDSGEVCGRETGKENKECLSDDSDDESD